MSNKPTIKNDSDLRRYFAAIPHLANLQLGMYSYRLYAYLIHLARGDAEVKATTKELAEGAGMSVGKVVESKQDLVNKGYIDVVVGYRHQINIRDIWPENMRTFGTDQENSARGEYSRVETRSPHERDQPKHVHHMNEIPETRSPHERDRRARSPHEQVIPNTERLVHHMNVHQRENATKRKKEKGEYILLDKWDLILAELYAGLSPATRGFLEGSQAFELGAFADGSRHYLIVINDAQNIAWVQSQLARRIGTLIQQIAIGQRAELELTIVDRAEFEEVEGKEREGEVSHAK